MKKIKEFILVLGAVSLMFLGCAGYYKVTDPGSGKVYYTQHISRKVGGAIRFKDSLSKSEVTLQESEVMEITRDQYEAAPTVR